MIAEKAFIVLAALQEKDELSNSDADMEFFVRIFTVMLAPSEFTRVSVFMSYVVTWMNW
jgi:hypothetical protein